MSGNVQTQGTTTGAPKPVKRTRLGGLWVVLALGAAVLVLLLVFILQNSQRVQIELFGADFHAPLGVALLLAAALGVLLVVVPGAGRIMQLRRAAKRMHREREDLAGRLDEVKEATSPSGAPAVTGGANQNTITAGDGGTAAGGGMQAGDQSAAGGGLATAPATGAQQPQGQQPPASTTGAQRTQGQTDGRKTRMPQWLRKS